MRPLPQRRRRRGCGGALTTLERTVLPLFYSRHDEFVDVMRYAIALNGSFFTAQRMLQEYMIKAHTSSSTSCSHLPQASCGRAGLRRDFRTRGVPLSRRVRNPRTI